MIQIRVIVLVASVAATGCSDFPDLDAAVSARARGADYPRLVELDAAQLVALAQPAEAAQAEELAVRAAALRRRARSMKSAIIDPATRRRMRAAVARYLAP